MTKAEEKAAEQKAAVRELRKIVKPGDTLHTILRHVSRSGMSRSISVVKVDKRGGIRQLDYLVAIALDRKVDDHREGIKIGGAGMDMGFALVYEISAKLYGYGNPRGYRCLGDRCPSNSHVNDRNAPSGKDVRHKDGYAISHRWM
jgi:hypothetical protein